MDLPQVCAVLLPLAQRVLYSSLQFNIVTTSLLGLFSSSYQNTGGYNPYSLQKVEFFMYFGCTPFSFYSFFFRQHIISLAAATALLTAAFFIPPTTASAADLYWSVSSRRLVYGCELGRHRADIDRRRLRLQRRNRTPFVPRRNVRHSLPRRRRRFHDPNVLRQLDLVHRLPRQ